MNVLRDGPIGPAIGGLSIDRRMRVVTLEADNAIGRNGHSGEEIGPPSYDLDSHNVRDVLCRHREDRNRRIFAGCRRPRDHALSPTGETTM
jgi:hypothetical protein